MQFHAMGSVSEPIRLALPCQNFPDLPEGVGFESLCRFDAFAVSNMLHICAAARQFWR